MKKITLKENTANKNMMKIEDCTQICSTLKYTAFVDNQDTWCHSASITSTQKKVRTVGSLDLLKPTIHQLFATNFLHFIMQKYA